MKGFNNYCDESKTREKQALHWSCVNRRNDLDSIMHAKEKFATTKDLTRILRITQHTVD
jgi:hypothetical protein